MTRMVMMTKTEVVMTKMVVVLTKMVMAVTKTVMMVMIVVVDKEILIPVVMLGGCVAISAMSVIVIKMVRIS